MISLFNPSENKKAFDGIFVEINRKVTLNETLKDIHAKKYQIALSSK